jgi:hypothetical protein
LVAISANAVGAAIAAPTLHAAGDDEPHVGLGQTAQQRRDGKDPTPIMNMRRLP